MPATLTRKPGVKARRAAYRLVLGALMIAPSLLSQVIVEGLGRGDTQHKDGVISGRVIASFDARPVRGALVVLNPSASQENRTPTNRHTFSDAGGNFRFTGLSNGYYRLTITKAGAEIAAGSRDAISLEGAEARAEVTLPMRRLPVAAGQVRGEEGKPLEGVQVTLYRRRVREGRALLQASGRGQTDDRGNYHISVREPGLYWLKASRPESSFAPRPTGIVFYPNSPDLQSARPVVLDFDQPEAQLDITLPWAPETRLIAAIYSGETGRPCHQCSWRLMRKESDSRYDIAAGTTNRLAGFSLGGIPPGQYRVFVEDREAPGWYALADADVVEGRQTELIIGTRSGTRVAGRVVLDNPAREILQRMREQDAAVQLYLQPAGDHVLATQAPPEAALPLDRLEFEIGPLPPHAFTVRLASMMASSYVARILRQGRPLNSPVLDLEDGGAWDNLEIHIRFDQAFIRIRPGSTLPTPDPSAIHPIVLLPDPETNPFGQPQRASCDGEGICFLSGLVPGRYRVFGVSTRADELPLEDPELAARIGSWATEVNLVPGENPPVSIPQIPENVERGLLSPRQQ